MALHQAYGLVEAVRAEQRVAADASVSRAVGDSIACDRLRRTERRAGIDHLLARLGRGRRPAATLIGDQESRHDYLPYPFREPFGSALKHCTARSALTM